MRKKIYGLYKGTLLNKGVPLVLSSVFTITLLFLSYDKAWGNVLDLPGLPVARLALPSISPQIQETSSTGTPVGEKVIELKNATIDLANRAASHVQATRDLYEKTIVDVNQYHLIVGEIDAKLQLGTTPANPNLIALKNQTLQKLEEISNAIKEMEGLAVSFSNNAQQIESLFSQSKQNFLLPGALDEDHANLILLFEELAKLNGSILQSREILDANTQRQAEWLNAERIHFTHLSAAIDKGKSQILLKESGPAYPVPSTLPDLPRPLIKEENQNRIEAHQSSEKPSSESLIRVPLLETRQEIVEEMAQSKSTLPLIEEEIQNELKTSESPSEPLALVPLSEPPHEVIAELPQVSPIEPLPSVEVAPHPKAQPIQEDVIVEAPPSSTPAPLMASDVINNRHPLAILDANQDVLLQKWYLFSTAKRGLKTPSDRLEIVNVMGNKDASTRGEEVKSLLIEMGIPAEQLRVINTQADESQPAQVYIFAG